MNYPLAVIKTNKNDEKIFEVDMDRVCAVADFRAEVNGIKQRFNENSFFHKKGVYLNDSYDWQIVRDNVGALVLLQLKKINQ